MALEFSRDLTQLFCVICRGGTLFCLEFPGVKLKNEKLQDFFLKVMPSIPCPVCFSSGKAQYSQCLTQKLIHIFSEDQYYCLFLIYIKQLDISKELEEKHYILKVENSDS